MREFCEAVGSSVTWMSAGGSGRFRFGSKFAL